VGLSAAESHGLSPLMLAVERSSKPFSNYSKALSFRSTFPVSLSLGRRRCNWYIGRQSPESLCEFREDIFLKELSEVGQFQADPLPNFFAEISSDAPAVPLGFPLAERTWVAEG
jgi:hypothetical protein